jgi:hypothetical protein
LSVRNFYDALAPGYHLVYQDWESTVARQGEALSALIANEWGIRGSGVIDASVGVGTQALGLAAKGYGLIGSDIAMGAVRRNRREPPKGPGTPVRGSRHADAALRQPGGGCSYRGSIALCGLFFAIFASAELVTAIADAGLVALLDVSLMVVALLSIVLGVWCAVAGTGNLPRSSIGT